MKLLVQGRRGLSMGLALHVSIAAESSVIYLALFADPKELSDPGGPGALCRFSDGARASLFDLPRYDAQHI